MPAPRLYANQAARQAAYRGRVAEARSKELQTKGMPPLPAVAFLPGNARWQAMIWQACLLLRTVRDEMQEYYDQRSAAWQESERGESFLDRLEAAEDVHTAAEDLVR